MQNLSVLLSPVWPAAVVAVAVIALTAIARPASAAGGPPTNLRCEYLVTPLGVDSPSPRLSWQLPGGSSSAYQVQIDQTKSGTAAESGQMYDSRKTASTDCWIIPAKLRLASRMRYYWRVRVWDGSGEPGPWSRISWFETGLLREGEWQGSWLASQAGGNGYHSELAGSPDDLKWVQIDLGSQVEVAAVRLFPARPYNWNEDVPGFGFPVRFKIEGSSKSDFSGPVILVDKTAEDFANPRTEPSEISFEPAKARYIRLTATSLFTRTDGQKLLALAELQILDKDGNNVALRKDVTAKDSIEAHGWGKSQLTEGLTRSTQPSTASPLFRRDFTLAAPVKSARAYVCGLGYCELRLNGRKVGDRVLDPPYTNFDKRALYSVYDVTALLQEGPNTVGAILGKGWFSRPPSVILQMNIELEDGSSTTVTTGPDWRMSNGSILENTLYHGETYDARLEQSGWDSPGFDDSSWQPAETSPAPTKQLSAQMIRPIRVTQDIKPVKVTNPKDGVFVYDFGQNFSGWCRLTLTANKGVSIRLRHAEVLYQDGTVNQENLRSARATDTYITKGEGIEVYEPRFTYHGFRYVQIEGFPGTPTAETLTGRVVHSDFPITGQFWCSDKLINQIQQNSVWGFRTNFHSIPTDCPQRDERQGWMGDAMMTADMGLYNFDVRTGYVKFLQDIQDSQGPNGEVPDTVPHVWGTQNGDPLWSAAYPVIAWEMFRHNGDLALLRKHYPGLKSYVDLLRRESPDFIISRSNYGDWVGVVETPRDLISTGSFHMVTAIVADAAEKLGLPDEAAEYRALLPKIADAFNKRFLNRETSSYGNGSQFSNAWPLFLGIVPPEHHAAVLKHLIDDITKNHNGHLSTGFIGTRYLFDVLCNEGYADVAYEMVTKTDYPGYGFMIANGATTIWELWKHEVGPGMNSHNHPAFGLISAWFYRYIAGIVPNWQHPGYEHFDIKPYLMGDLKEARASVETVRGTAASHWKRVEGRLTLDVIVPPGSRANVWVPKIPGNAPVTMNGKTIFSNGAPAANSGAEDRQDWVLIEVGPGEHAFREEVEQ